jgi:hypothetical protein
MAQGFGPVAPDAAQKNLNSVTSSNELKDVELSYFPN